MLGWPSVWPIIHVSLWELYYVWWDVIAIWQNVLPPNCLNYPNHVQIENIMSDTSCNISNELAKYLKAAFSIVTSTFKLWKWFFKYSLLSQLYLHVLRPMLGWCLPIVYNAGPTSAQHWAKIYFVIFFMFTGDSIMSEISVCSFVQTDVSGMVFFM